MNKPYINIAAYCFFELNAPESFRAEMKNRCLGLQLKGSILLSTEGINLMLSGLPEDVNSFKDYLHKELGFPEMAYKESWSQEKPFRRMLVKLKKEIISFGYDVHPADFTGPRLAPQKFKKWLDENRDMTVLDTRNDYEIAVGKFKNALDLKAKTFREFAEKAASLPQEIKDKPMVMYCTGGIRCEKASALFLKDYGFKEVYQLEGGILKYLEECGSAHYEGECFVFDQRVGLNDKLAETDTTQCYGCRMPLKPEDQHHPSYQPGVSCRHCIHEKNP